jgi:adenosylmethionine-8-amino-7-oxononanoate aminotransferase
VVAAHPAASAELARRVREAGVLVRPLATAIAVSPPLTVTVDHLATIADGIRAGLDAMRELLPGPVTLNNDKKGRM